ncbi:unnamed protein product [Urochloa decumbens]|uniref:Uncharacterized protein n=1 Tax=Urochloa decumbens TaxID=240449 RepID=A0ABC8VWY4_9POAL
MEVVFVSEILKTLGTKLALVIKELSSIAAVDKDLVELQNRVEEINIWLQTVDDHAMRNNQSANWLKRLKDAAYDAEDLVHEFHTEVEKHDSKVVFECKTAHKIKAIKKTFDAIVKERSDYSANSMHVVHPFLHINKTTGEVPLWTNVDEKSIFGRDQVKSQIISKLIDTKDQQSVNIVSVIGLGGSGKTTLAKLVFNDCNIIKEYFEAILWVHVSREFCVEKIVEKLFEAIADEKPDHLPLQHVSRTISNKLAGKRFLLVLADVWTEDRIHWEQFMVHLKSGAPGSSILLTTRSRQVAEAVDSTYTFDLPFLSEVDSWKVFQQSLGMSIKGLDPEFLQVGIEIVKKCGGVPLAIKVLAGVLRGMKGINEWQSIRESNLLDVEDDEHRVDSKLFDKVRALYISKSNIVFDRTENSRYCVRTIILDSIHATSLPLFISKFELLGYLEISNVNCEELPEAISQCWNLQSIHVIGCQRFATLPESIGKLKKLRTLELVNAPRVRTLPQSIDGCDNLQSLYLHDCRLKDIPDSVANIGKLRVLSIVCCIGFRKPIPGCCPLQHLPQCITMLSHMEYIDLKNCCLLEELPEGIRNLKMLKVLNLQGCQKLCGLPAGCGQLTRLQKLGLFVVGDKAEYARISELENLDKLSGKLRIKNISCVKDSDDAEKVHLKKKNGIRKLSLDWYSRENDEQNDEVSFVIRMKEVSLLDMEKDLDLLNNLEPPSDIEKLRISGYRGSFFNPRHAHCNVSSPFFCTVDEKPPHITQLKLGGLIGSSSGWELLQHLNGLRELEISKCKDLRHLPESMRSLTCLQKLDINWCDNLVLPEWLGELQSLQILNIIGLPLMSSLPQSIQSLTLLQDLYVYYCHALHQVPEQLGELCSLRRLQLCNLPGLTSLPESLQRLTSLVFLNLCNCATFEQLPMSLGELPALQTLWIQACPALTSLPCCIKRLAALEELTISGCPDLVRRCKEKVGEDWHLVSHIPYLKLS